MIKKLNNLNISIFTALKVSEISGVPMLMLSNPGVGKTSTVYMFAKVRNYEVVMLRGNSTSAEEIMGYDVAPKDVVWDKPQAACHLRPSWFETVLKNKEKGKKSLLFLDELTTANEFVQAALLYLIFERKCGNERIPDDTLIVSCGNYCNNLASSFQMLSPVLNRFCIYNIIPNVDDLDIFLNRYDGSLINEGGVANDYMKELEEALREIDSNERVVSEGDRNKIGFYFERSIKECTKFLMGGTGLNTAERKIDLSVTDLQDIYLGVNDVDPRVYGFVTFRTMNYLREVAIATYLCFGKEGISSDNFRNMVDGLCGIGVSRKVSSDEEYQANRVIKNKIGKEYFDLLNKAANEVESLNNNKLPVYQQFFKGVMAQEVGIPMIQSIINKIIELQNDHELDTIDRPIDKEVLLDISQQLRSYSYNLVSYRVGMGNGTKITDEISIDQLASIINNSNALIDCFNTIFKLLDDKARNYDQDTIDSFKSLVGDVVKRSIMKAKTLKMSYVRYLNMNNETDAIAMIPELKEVLVK